MILLTLARRMILDELDLLERNIRSETFELQFVITHAKAMAQVAADALEMAKKNESPIYLSGDGLDHDEPLNPHRLL
jgi:hypothetical protein